ncbi:MAG: 23S rRNA (guanosine(2251)-2'-O)-methyltransferase RlmB [Parachlamydiales bacterium]|nr:23S rRNA (guanosine(2251)-2'-O)-methyltransferase RlmB [Parachlamydiales bacterium]
MSNIIMGKNTIKEVLKYKPFAILQIFTCLHDTDELLEEIKDKNIPVQKVSKQSLEKMVETTSHQNIIAKIKSRRFLELKDFLKSSYDKEESLVLMLDSIYDPQNFGAILRAAECFQIDAVIFSKNRGSDITPVVTKSASGATELLDILKISNLANTLDQFIDAGYQIISTAIDEKAENLFSFKFPKKAVLIMGSEGEGVQKILLNKSDHLVYIPMMGKIDSLNVSQATAVILATIRYQATQSQ